MATTKPGAEGGFTLPELIVTGALFLLLVVGATFLLNPDDHGAESRNGVRWTSVALITQGLKKYVADNGGNLPEGLPDKTKLIGSEDGTYDLCPALVPLYMDDLPLDPQVGVNLSEESCIKDGAAYISGFSIVRDKDGSVTVAAPQAELDERIAITLKP